MQMTVNKNSWRCSSEVWTKKDVHDGRNRDKSGGWCGSILMRRMMKRGSVQREKLSLMACY